MPGTAHKGNNRRKIIIAIVIIGVLLLIGWASGLLSGQDVEKVEIDEVEKRTIVEKVTASGKLRPDKEVKITADVSGEITLLPVNEGEKVSKGELLVQINPDEYESAVKRAKASLNNARANLAQAKSQLTEAKAQLKNSKQVYDRNKRLFEKDAIAKSEFEKIQSEFKTQKARVESTKQTVKAAKFNVKSRKASLDEAKDKLDKTQIFAPVKGTLSSLSVEEGERVVGTRQMEGTEIMRIADLNSMQMLVEVNENDIVAIREGDTADIEIDAFVDRAFKGIVSHVSNSAKQQEGVASSDKVTNFEVEVDVLPSSYQDLLDTSRKVATPLRPGMSGMVRIKTERVKDAIAVPILVVTTRQPKAEIEREESDRLKEVVFLFNDGKAIRQNVKTGIQDNYYIQVKEGLEAGQEVISGPYSAVSKTLKDSVSVKRESTEE